MASVLKPKTVKTNSKAKAKVPVVILQDFMKAPDEVDLEEEEDDDFKPVNVAVKRGSISRNEKKQKEGKKEKSQKRGGGGKPVNLSEAETQVINLEDFDDELNFSLNSSSSRGNARDADKLDASGSGNSDVENVEVDMEEMEEEVEVVFAKTSPLKSPVKGDTNNNGKAAWKGLMEQMRSNQKKVGGSVKGKGTKGKTGFKRGMTQSPQKDKTVVSPLKKVPRLRLEKMDLETNKKPTESEIKAPTPLTEEPKPSTSAAAAATTTAASNSKPETKANLAPLFLSPTERKKLQGSKTTSPTKTGDTALPRNKDADATASLLASIIKSSECGIDLGEEEPGTDNPNHFDGDTVLLNLDQPADDPYEGKKTKNCPFYKKLPGTSFCVDAFNYGLVPGMEVYFLSHFHSDHYIGLSKKFCKTLICSHPTGNLVRMKLYVEEKCIRKLRQNKAYIISGSEVTLINANHCPGSVMFVFRLKTGKTILHTGDFRYTPEMLSYPSLKGLRVDWLYLDTTYCDPKYDFPTQWDSVSTVVKQIKKHLDYRPKTLILCGSYLIGKERVYMTLAEAIGSKVFATTDKRKIINALENRKFSELLTGNENDAIVHVVNMVSINPKNLHEYLEKRPQYTNIIGIKPSGWQFSSCGNGCSVKTHYGDSVTIIGIPYSEHSSFSELKEFVSALRPKRVQPTVNVGNAKKRGEMMGHIENWLYN